jgi:threonine dehydrogenase-like Zn-dependent dehydrogenase
MHAGDVLGHETMGEVVEVGKGHSKFKIGECVVVPFTIAWRMSDVQMGVVFPV